MMRPIDRLMMIPVTTPGLYRKPAWKADRVCTRWKKRLVICSKALKDAQIRKTLIQILVKTRSCQRLLGMRAGRPSRSCRWTQRMKIGIRSRLSVSRAIVIGRLIAEVVLARELNIVR